VSHNTNERGLEAVKVHLSTSGELKSPTNYRLLLASALKDWIKLILLVK